MKKIGLITGVFDVLHKEHERFLREASEAVDELWVGLESDRRVKKLKGEKRPIYQQDKRKERLQVKFPWLKVFILPDDFEKQEVREQLLTEVKPNLLIIGENDPKKNEKWLMMKKIGGKIKEIKENPLISTTKILNDQKLAEKLIFPEDKKIYET